MRFRIPDPPLPPLGGIASHLYTAKNPSFGLRWCHRLGLTDSHGSHPLGYPMFGLCLASTCALIIADLDPLVKGFSINFVRKI